MRNPASEQNIFHKRNDSVSDIGFPFEESLANLSCIRLYRAAGHRTDVKFYLPVPAGGEDVSVEPPAVCYVLPGCSSDSPGDPYADGEVSLQPTWLPHDHRCRLSAAGHVLSEAADIQTEGSWKRRNEKLMDVYNA